VWRGRFAEGGGDAEMLADFIRDREEIKYAIANLLDAREGIKSAINNFMPTRFGIKLYDYDFMPFRAEIKFLWIFVGEILGGVAEN